MVAPFPCPYCGATLMSKRLCRKQASGCLIMLLGIILIPAFGIGLLVIALGVWIHQTGERVWSCIRCRATIPRA
jgi:hypothetical protein